MATHLTWPFVTSIFVGIVFVALAQPLSVQTTRVTPIRIDCVVDDGFATAYDELNQVRPPDGSNNAAFFPSGQEGSGELPEFPTFR